MFEHAILVLLYNKEIKASSTLKSLINSEFKYNNTQLVIWNNGPNKLQNTDCTQFEKLGYKVTINETIDNRSLAHIYNDFMAENLAEKYIFLDDDSHLTSGYILASSKINMSEVGMPIITSLEAIRAPIINMKPYELNSVLSPEDLVMTIGSGLVIGRLVSEAIHKRYDSVFDERFFLYGVDNVLCIRLHRAKLTTSIKIITGFEHSLSRLENESVKTTKFRQKERSYSTGLELRYYKNFLDAATTIARSGLITFKNIMIGKKRSISFFHLIKAYITGKHYRAN